MNVNLHISDKEPRLEGNDAPGVCAEAVQEPQDLENTEYRQEENGTPTELQIYENQEDEYEVFDLRIIHRKNRTGFEENKDFPVVLSTIIAGRYYVTEYLGSAAFSKVIQAHDLQTGMDVCLKIIKNDKDFFDQSLDEIKLLKFVNKHDPGDEHHILRLYDYFYHQEHLFIVCELLRANLYEFQKYNHESGGEVYFTLPRLQSITRQCLEALEYLHQLGIVHCDLKPENILIKSYSRCEIKVIDLGSSCFQSDNLCLYVQSRSYRAPEVILGLPYDSKIDIWSLGCILAELCSGEVLFANDTLVMLLARMIGMLGPIDMDMLVRGQETHKYFTGNYDLYHTNEESGESEYIAPEKYSLAHHLQFCDAKFIKFISDLLQTNPMRRPSAREALQHSWLAHSYQ
ncbi:DYRK-family kinase pom1 isoform X2 [Aristolochia californica]